MNAAAPASARINNKTKKAYFIEVKGNKHIKSIDSYDPISYTALDETPCAPEKIKNITRTATTVFKIGVQSSEEFFFKKNVGLACSVN